MLNTHMGIFGIWSLISCWGVAEKHLPLLYDSNKCKLLKYTINVHIFIKLFCDPRTLLLTPLHQRRVSGCLCTQAQRGWRWLRTSVCPAEQTPTSGYRLEQRSFSNSSERMPSWWGRAPRENNNRGFCWALKPQVKIIFSWKADVTGAANNRTYY